jgi:hypothetical protein
MASLNISALQSTALQPTHFLGQNHKKSGHIEAANMSGIGQLPVGAGPNLLGNALQALEQAIGTQSASVPAPALVGGHINAVV